KPEAPVEIRGEFKPIKTNVPGIDICELLPLQAKIADRFSIIRGVRNERLPRQPNVDDRVQAGAVSARVRLGRQPVAPGRERRVAALRNTRAGIESPIWPVSS